MRAGEGRIIGGCYFDDYLSPDTIKLNADHFPRRSES